MKYLIFKLMALTTLVACSNDESAGKHKLLSNCTKIAEKLEVEFNLIPNKGFTFETACVLERDGAKTIWIDAEEQRAILRGFSLMEWANEPTETDKSPKSNDIRIRYYGSLDYGSCVNGCQEDSVIIRKNLQASCLETCRGLLGKEEKSEDLPAGVSKFQDERNTCYLYHSKGISCVRKSALEE